MEKKSTKEKLKKVIHFIMGCLFVIYLTLYISQLSGYYEYQLNQKTELTDEKIKQFENDIKEGKEIDLNSYVVNENKYSNKIGSIGMNASRLISKYTTKGIEGFFSLVSNLVEE